MNTEIEKWTYEQFITFLLIHASYADLEFTEPEQKAILDQVPQDTFDEVNTYYNKLGEYEQLNVIMTCKDRFIKTQDDKAKMMNLLSNQFQADGAITKLELLMMDFLDRLIEV
jgi:hypothetical protein